MDLSSIAVNLITARAQSNATSAAVSILKSNFGSEKAIAELLTSSANSSSALASGLGANLDVTV